MTKKERMLELIDNYNNGFTTSDEMVYQVECIFAMTQEEFDAHNEKIRLHAIQFAEWISGNGFQQYDGADRWISSEYSGARLWYTRELHKQFKIENP